MELDRLIEGLSRPEAYPHEVDAVELRQTHISLVFLAGPLVYKIRKPVQFNFVDFSTLEQRRHDCDQEVRLNRRLAPDVYLGVVPITVTDGGLRIDGPGEPVEWAVVMRRLPADATLKVRLQRGEVDAALAEALARRIARFHQDAETSEYIASFGRIPTVTRNLLDIFEQSIPHIGMTVSRPVFERFLFLTREGLARHRDLIEARSASRRTRNCHGDLHLDHVYYFPEQAPPADLVIIDCIEFNERFRYIDPVADMAFPLMDFLFHGRRDLAEAYTAAYFAASGDEAGRALLPLYTAYRASVRGSVEGLKLAGSELAESDRQATLRSSRAHWLVGLGQLEEPGRRPCLVLVGGLPGTGKTTLARGLAEEAGFTVIRSDVVRKELAAACPEPPVSIYDAEWNERTYAECLRRAEEAVFEGQRVVVDATFREEQRRQQFLQAAVSWGVRAVLFLTQADPATVRKRIEARRGDASDADWAIYQRFAACWEEPAGSTRQAVCTIATDGSAAEYCAAALAALRERSLAGTKEPNHASHDPEGGPATAGAG